MNSHSIFRIYLKILSLCYFLGALLHILDILNLRLQFTSLSHIWKIWIIYLAIADFVASIGLWKNKSYGIFSFLFVASSQLIAYLAYEEIFGEQTILIYFHLVTLTIFGFLAWGRNGTKRI